ncbi:MAG: hypothetical protein O2954_15295 [bacterium]|nr:hypothetical protein [bacterium]
MAVDLIQVVRDLREQLQHYKKRVEEQNVLLRREAAIERVRSEALMMGTTNHLGKVVAVMWQQMQEMGIQAQVSIEFIELEKDLVHVYFAIPNPGKNGVTWKSSSVVEISPNIAVATWEKSAQQWSRLAQWRQGNVWSFVRSEAETREASEELVKRFGFSGPILPHLTESYFTAIPFENGTVQVSRPHAALSEDQIDFVQELTQALDLGFVRFLDLQQIRQQTEELNEEQRKSERLLLNILPESIAQQLKQEPAIIANHFPEVTVLFADIVGFTRLSALISPEELITLLNEIFSAFDRLAETHGVEKIKTIGDSYMVVAGLPDPCSNHAQTVANMALDMKHEIECFKTRTGDPLHLRIGIHTGPVIAGVIGTKKFSYDLWGDTVNIASRMESHGLVDAIQVSQATHDCLQTDYLFEPRGEIEIKDKGKMPTYLLREKRT